VKFFKTEPPNIGYEKFKEKRTPEDTLGGDAGAGPIPGSVFRRFSFGARLITYGAGFSRRSPALSDEPGGRREFNYEYGAV
jgi:hypothetical protein